MVTNFMHATHYANSLCRAYCERFNESTVFRKIFEMRRGSMIETISPCKVNEHVGTAQFGTRIVHREYITFDSLCAVVDLL